jgi:hypothetical protein
MGTILRIVGLIAITFALVSCGGGVYIAMLVIDSVAPGTPLAVRMRTSVVTTALISSGIFVAGAMLFAAGTRKLESRRSHNKEKTERVTCPSCSGEYSAKRLRCPSCGEENDMHRTPSRNRGALFDRLPIVGDLSGVQRGMVLSALSVLGMLALAAFFLAAFR